MKNTKILNKVYIVTKTLCFDRKTITTFFSNEFYTTVELAKLAVHNKESIIYKTSDKYIGCSEYLENDCIYNASKKDFKHDKENQIPIVEYIKNAYEKIQLNDNKGVIFIRTRDSKIIDDDKFIKKHFKIEQLNAKDGKIGYKGVGDLIQSMLDAAIGTITNKPIIFFIKGAYRAGITLEKEYKDYIYLVYDDSSKAEATAQGLLGRMCGYRTGDKYLNTIFYINKQHAEDYAEWESDFTSKGNIPTTSTPIWVDASDTNNSDISIKTKGNVNFDIILDDDEVKRFVIASLNKDVSNIEFAKNELRILKPDFKFDYLGEAYISGKNRLSESVITKWFNDFEYNDNCPSFRPSKSKDFKQVNSGRDKLVIADVGTIICHVMLDADVYLDADKNILKIEGNKRLLVYHGILAKQRKIKNTKSLIKEHKITE